MFVTLSRKIYTMDLDETWHTDRPCPGLTHRILFIQIHEVVSLGCG